MISNPDQPILFFDGSCGLCHGTVRFLLKADKGKRLRFVPLQSEKAKDLLGDRFPNNSDFSSVLFWVNGKLVDRSTAVLKSLILAGGAWKLAVVFLWVPKGLRDGIYAWVSKNRLAWFGKAELCDLSERDPRILL